MGGGYGENAPIYGNDYGDDVHETKQPTLTGDQKKIVMVTHDEATFYANESKEKGWFLSGEIQLKAKGPGRSVMVSEFQCPCHGTMRHNGMISRKLFKAGAGREGYWSHQEVVRQLKEEAIPIFRALHADCIVVFLFDQSSNHEACSSDALVASRMSRDAQLYEEGKTKY
jgi:hypothetical protein